MQELEERVANVRARGRILTDFLYSLGRGNTSPSPAGVRPRGQRPVSPAGGRTPPPPTVPWPRRTRPRPPSTLDTFTS